MTLDKEEHRTILAQLIEQSAFPGKFAEEVVILKQAIANAVIETPVGLERPRDFSDEPQQRKPKQVA